MTADFDLARTLAHNLISFVRDKEKEKDMEEIIREQVDKVIDMLSGNSEFLDREQLIKELETIFSTWIGEAITLEGKDTHEPWLFNKRQDIDWCYWRRYRQYLQQGGWAEATLEKLDELTYDTLGRLEDPTRKGAWDRRGVIVGHVQSGKTSNYIGLINKAADAGYKLIIVLTGMHDNLRSQTQMRLDEGFLGYDSGTRTLDSSNKVQIVGVGKIDPSVKRPDTITTRLPKGDFRRSVAEHFNINPGGNPLLFVLKKNGNVLKNLLDWVEWATTNTDEDGRKIVSGVPLLVIDDESDWGSIDTRDEVIGTDGKPDLEHSPTVLNGRIRKLLFSFEQSAYVGYTATPFANIFIHERAKTKDFGEDLFPRSFITSLPYPSNYISPSYYFGISEDDTEIETPRRELPIFRIIRDNAITQDLSEREGWMPPIHDSYHVPRFDGDNKIPPSLREALLSFILVCAVRTARGQIQSHNSMLVHVTKFVNVQKQIYDQIFNELMDVRNRVKYEESDSKGSVLNELKNLWENDFVPTTEWFNEREYPIINWPTLSNYILRSLSSIQIKQINGTSADVLDYYQYRNAGLNVIVIGGDKLSRGLTLEGLSISYFLRSSKMYDTLMQMGRWFGYRPGYLDLCRLYTSAELKEWLHSITKANEELRHEFEYMAIIGGTPIDYGLRIRSDSELLITSRVKMRHGMSMQLTFSGSISETISFYKDKTKNDMNLVALENIVDGINRDGIKPEQEPIRKRTTERIQSWKGSYYWKNVPAENIKRFMEQYITHYSSHKVDCKLLKTYIENQNENDDLTKWTVMMPAGSSKEYYDLRGCGKITLVIRAWDADQVTSVSDHLSIGRLVSPRDESIDLTNEEYAEALNRTISEWKLNKEGSRRKKAPEEPSGISIRNIRNRKNGLMLIYLLEPPPDKEYGDDPIVAFALSFPGNPNDKKVTYVVNNVYYKQEMGLA